jgi:mRNA-degrading endonuclease toxin of MazEF toxin-antitoxin module
MKSESTCKKKYKQSKSKKMKLKRNVSKRYCVKREWRRMHTSRAVVITPTLVTNTPTITTCPMSPTIIRTATYWIQIKFKRENCQWITKDVCVMIVIACVSISTCKFKANVVSCLTESKESRIPETSCVSGLRTHSQWKILIYWNIFVVIL